jgi:hypothetical protein
MEGACCQSPLSRGLQYSARLFLANLLAVAFYVSSRRW